jgi:putative tricarboxylic transport membrane protein
VMPVVLVLCLAGAFADNNNLFDVWVMVGAGGLGYAMRRLDYDPASLVLGLVLGPVMERSLVQALTISGGDIGGLWDSGGAAVMLVGSVIGALFPAVRGLVRLAH